ncbi:hypothetical protein ACA910_018003 [Epithemia clementina (nom. ined.)]
METAVTTTTTTTESPNEKAMRQHIQGMKRILAGKRQGESPHNPMFQRDVETIRDCERRFQAYQNGRLLQITSSSSSSCKPAPNESSSSSLDKENGKPFAAHRNASYDENDDECDIGRKKKTGGGANHHNYVHERDRGEEGLSALLIDRRTR